MKNKALAILFFTLVIGLLNFSHSYAEDRFLLLDSSDTIDSYLDSATLAVTKDDRNCIYYDAWIKIYNKQEIQKLNIYTNQYEYLDYQLFHMIIAISHDKKMIQLQIVKDYGKSGTTLFTNRIVKPTYVDITKGSIAEELADRITEYVSKNHIEPIPVSNEEYLPLNEKEFYNLFESKGYKINKIEESKGPNVDGDIYGSSTTPYSFLDIVIDKEIYLGVSGEDKQHLRRASVSFNIKGPNYKQSEILTYNLPSEEKLNLFYMTLQALFPDWAQDESKNWVDSSIARMNQSNTLMFIYLHKGKEYIMISRQPVEDDVCIAYVLKVSQIQPSEVNPIRPYYERNGTISVYEEWKPAQN